jgi:hypothetical protein
MSFGSGRAKGKWPTSLWVCKDVHLGKTWGRKMKVTETTPMVCIHKWSGRNPVQNRSMSQTLVRTCSIRRLNRLVVLNCETRRRCSIVTS